MKQLSEFNSLEEARNHTEIKGKLVHRNSMNAWLSKAGKYRKLKEIAADLDNPLGDGVAAFLDSSEYNLIQSSETGQAVIQLMQALIVAEGDDTALQEVLDKGIAAANEVFYPYANTSDYDFAKSKNLPIPKTEAILSQGWIKYQITEDCEYHTPAVYAKFNGVEKQIGTLPPVYRQGVYLYKVQSGYYEYKIDNYYGVLECLP